LGKIWCQDSGITDEENATFLGDADAARKRKGLIDQERSAFSGNSGFDSRVSGQGSTAGQY